MYINLRTVVKLLARY